MVRRGGPPAGRRPSPQMGQRFRDALRHQPPTQNRRYVLDKGRHPQLPTPVRPGPSPINIDQMGPKRPVPTSPPPNIASITQALAQPPQHPAPGLPTQPSPAGPTTVPPAPTGQVAPSAPAPEPTINPYTGRPLGANEYVGVAGSEAEHPGMTRIPPPGWWDKSNANYERRNYTVGKHGEIVASEAGFTDPSHPYNTGRPDERNTEFEARSGLQHIHMSEPGVIPWGPGGKFSTASLPGGAQAPAVPRTTAQAQNPASILAALAGGQAQPQHPNEQLLALLRALLGQVPGGNQASIPA